MTREYTDSPLVFNIGEIKGALACWVVRQSPYNSIDGLSEAFQLFDDALSKRRHTGSSSARPDLTYWGDLGGMLFVEYSSYSQLHEFIDTTIRGSKVAEQWNTPKSGHNSDVYISRVGSLAPEHDFIGIDALVRNVSRMLWSDAELDREQDVKQQKK